MDSEAKAPTTKRVLFKSLVVDGTNLLLNSAVAIATGSVVLLVAAFQSLAELATSSLLFYGKRYADKRPTKLHPFGFGKEMYYWATLAAFIVIALTGALALRFGYQEMLDPTKIQHVIIGVIVLAAALLANIYSFKISARKILGEAPFGELGKVFSSSPHLAAKATLVLDVMGSVSSAIGLVFLSLAWATGSTSLDGIGAGLMGFVLLGSGVALLFSVRGLVTGQSAPPELERKIRDAARDVPEVKHVLGMRTMMLGSDKLLVNIEVHLKDGMNTDQVEAAVERVKEAIEGAAEGLQVHVEPDPYTDVHAHHKN